MAAPTEAPAKLGAFPPLPKTAPTPDAHRAVAADHAAAQHHHIAAAFALTKGDHKKAQDHARAADLHGDHAGDLNDEIEVVYDVWNL